MSKHDRDSKQIEFNCRSPLSEVAEQLQQLVDGLEAGSLTVTNQHEQITMTPSGVVEMNLQVKQKADEERVMLEFRWQRESARGRIAALQIKSGDEPDENGEEEVVLVETETPVSNSSGSSRQKKSRKR